MIDSRSFFALITGLPLVALGSLAIQASIDNAPEAAYVRQHFFMPVSEDKIEKEEAWQAEGFFSSRITLLGEGTWHRSGF
jgi:hypothetical protein